MNAPQLLSWDDNLCLPTECWLSGWGKEIKLTDNTNSRYCSVVSVLKLFWQLKANQIYPQNSQTGLTTCWPAERTILFWRYSRSKVKAKRDICSREGGGGLICWQTPRLAPGVPWWHLWAGRGGRGRRWQLQSAQHPSSVTRPATPKPHLKSDNMAVSFATVTVYCLQTKA